MFRLFKEKKKLTNKVESLTRKVQNLQTKLASSRESVISTSANQLPAAPRQTPPALTLAPVPLQSSGPSIPSQGPHPPSTPRSRGRIVSVPSALPPAKTPEYGYIPQPVFRAKTPEPKQFLQPLRSGPMPTVSSIGIKRPPPDDGDESAPVQGFTADGAFDPDRNLDATSNRMRKNLRTGFTPVRNTTSRPMTVLAQVSPVKGRDTSVIFDVTNSPRAHTESSSTKRSWLGKMRGGASSQGRSTATPRTNVFEEHTHGHPP